RPIRGDQIRFEPDQVGRKFGEPSGVGLDPPVLDTNVHAFVPAAILQTRPEGLPPMRLARVRRFVPQDADAVNPYRPLRACGKRRKSKTDSENDREPDQPHAHLAWECWRKLTQIGKRCLPHGDLVDPRFTTAATSATRLPRARASASSFSSIPGESGPVVALAPNSPPPLTLTI